MAKLHFLYGPMNSGKSAGLLQVVRNYQDGGQKTLILKPNIDNREGTDPVVHSRTGLSAPCTLFSPDCNLFELVAKHCGAVDQAFDRITGKDPYHVTPAWAIDDRYYDKVNVKDKIIPIACVLIDEGQFMTIAQVKQLTDIVDCLGIPVMAYGLTVDFQGNPFPASAQLMASAEELREIRGICHCGSRSNHVLRVGPDGTAMKEGPQISVGGNDMYYSVCRKHWKMGAYKRPV